MVKAVSFKEDEKDIIQYLKINGYDKGFSYYVKGLIKKDMQGYTPVKKEEETHKPRRNANFDI